MSWTDRLSLRVRLLCVVALLLATALLIAGLLTVSALGAQLRTQVDDNLREVGGSGPALNRLLAQLNTSSVLQGDALPSQYVVQKNFDDGTHGLPQDDGHWDRDLPELPWVHSSDLQRSHEFRTLGRDDDAWRLLITKVTYQDPTGPIDGTIVIALPLRTVHQTLQSVAFRFALASAVLLGGMLLMGYFAIGRAFRPLREVQAVARAFGGGDTTRRVDVTAPRSEVGQLGQSMNSMLQRIESTLAAREASEERMRRFVGDASHELRTPLAAVRGFAELFRMGAVTEAEDVRRTFRRIEDESTRMATLVEDLLVLARMDAQRPIRTGPVDLLVLAADAAHNATVLAPQRSVTVTGLDGGSPHPVPLTGDEDRLRQVVTNLMANAIRHTPADTPIRLAVGVRDEQAVLEVIDHGPGVRPEVADKVFERFFRADDSRSRESGGSGLGLAIVAAIVAAHAGTTRLRQTPGGGATFVVTLPITSSQPAPSRNPRAAQRTDVS